jgi:hypothetical protein
MPAVLLAIATLITRYFLARLLVGAGLSIVTYSFINNLLTRLQDMLGDYLYSIPSTFVYIIDLLNFDFYVAVLMNCYGLAIGIKSAKVFIGKA